MKDAPFDVRAHIDSRLDSEHAAAALGMDTLDKLLTERHTYFDSQIRAVARESELRHDMYLGLNVEHRTYVDAQLAALRASFASAFAAQERAAQKAEEAQERHNQQTNGYEAQLLEQYRNMLPRAEADISHQSLRADIGRLTADLSATQLALSNVQVQLATKDQGEDRRRTKFDSTWGMLIGLGLVLFSFLNLIGALLASHHVI